MLFSNNMEYDEGEVQPIQGAFYASPAYGNPVFNYFREEEILNLTALLKPLSEQTELSILKDNNLEVIRSNPEFITNKDPNRPTNRMCTSLLSRERLAFVLRFALAYVHETDGLQKHVMRYPQLFATKAIERKLNAGIKKGIIWHTQGSGKTALAYYNVRFLTDYFQRKHIIPKFYFIVDRLDLLTQPKTEFSSRGLTVHTIETREAFSRAIKATQVIHNHSGKPEITVVNIQKFADDPDVVSSQDYDVNIQRVYFLDEVHRSYKPEGSFLANLEQSDRNAVKIGLTGTPLLGDKKTSPSWVLFGDYIHKYYYNASIADGYTLRLIREEIATNYKLTLQKTLADLQIAQGDLDKKQVYAHPAFVSPMLDYIISDFEKSRGALNDSAIGGMVICDSSEQAKQLFEQFTSKYAKPPAPIAQAANDGEFIALKHAAEPKADYKIQKKTANQLTSAALPSNIFATTGTNVSILFIDTLNLGNVVLIDASNLGEKIKDGKNQKTVLTAAEEQRIIDVFNDKQQQDDFSVVVSYSQIKDKNYSLSAGQYFDVKIDYVDITPEQFAEKMQAFTDNLDNLFSQSRDLEAEIKTQLAGLRYE